MQKALTPKQMRELDAYMIGEVKIPSLLLMENAAMGIFEAVRELAGPCAVHVFCGVGNNGGDGFAVARILLTHGYDAYVFVLGDLSGLTEDAAKNYEMFEKMPGRCIQISDIEDYKGSGAPRPAIIIDAIFGTGLAREVSGIYRDVIEMVNRSGAYVISADIPSGIDGGTGQALGCAVKADITVTFQYPKIGHFLFPGRDYAGRLKIVKIGVDDGAEHILKGFVTVYESDGAGLQLGKRAQNTNKGDFGRLLIIAGSYGMAGAAVLCAKAAVRAGAGLTTVASCHEVVDILQASVPEATCKAITSEQGVLVHHSIFDIERAIKGKTALAAGPGLSLGNDMRAIVEHIIQNHNIIKVLDADAINAIAGHADVLLEKEGQIILTPHPKEFAGLIDGSLKSVLENPIHHAREFAKKYGVVLVLKGATTVIANERGDITLVCAGSPGMSKGGSGDVLTGIIAGMAAQGKTAYDAALYGVYISAAAGEMAAGECGEYAMSASDSIGKIGDATELIRSGRIKADTVKCQPEADGAILPKAPPAPSEEEISALKEGIREDMHKGYENAGRRPAGPDRRRIG